MHEVESVRQTDAGTAGPRLTTLLACVEAQGAQLVEVGLPLMRTPRDVMSASTRVSSCCWKVGKSLTSLAAGVTAREGLPAVWLTPLIGVGGTEVSSLVRAALREATAPMLLVGGTADAAWNGQFASSVPNATVLELPDADHVLEAPDDVGQSLNHLIAVTEAISRFLAELG